MDPFLALRHQAAVKRDEAIAVARRIYRADLKAIQALERRIPPAGILEANALDKTGLNTVELIRSLLPLDRAFTTAEAMEWLAKARPGQQFKQATIRVYLWRLSRMGIVRKLCATNGNEAMWAATEAAEENLGIKAMTLPKMVEAVLQDAGKPLNMADIVAAMHEQGYRSNTTPHSLMRAIRDMFKRCPRRFARGEDGRWRATD